MAQQPDYIHLSPIVGRMWRDVPAVRALMEPLLTRGFAEGGSYTINEMPGLVVHFSVKPDESIYAAVYEHPKAGVWFDLVSAYQDGTSITLSSSSRGGGLDPRPGHPIVHTPGLDPLSAYAKFKMERPQGRLKPTSAASIVRDFEIAYAETTAWRKNKGISAKEVAKVAREK